MLFLDGIYTENKYGKTRFQRTNAPDQRELTELVDTISHRVAGFFEREGILERGEENSYLNLEGDEDPMQQVLGCSVSYRIAIGPQQGRKVFTLQTIPSWEDDDRFAQVAKESGFSLHAGVATQAWERTKLERLCRYITRPAVSEKRLSSTQSGNIRYDVHGCTNAASARGARAASSKHRTAMERPMPSSSLWTSLPSWLLWSPNRE
ncbi:MAG: hypothetical protein GY815_17320 [Gammaproteobacteria bacterium]|nr:hypothetical protein [Gammaproteobacteria bacterium]